MTVFLLCVLAGRLRHLARCCPFRFTWWAVSFPMAAASIDTLKIAITSPGPATDIIAIAVLACTTLVIAWLFGRTLKGFFARELKTLAT